MASSSSTQATTAEDDGFSAPITHKRAPKNRRGAKNRPRERTLDERVDSRLDALERSGYLEKCAGECIASFRRMCETAAETAS